MSLGQRLKQIRIEKKLTQKELANLMETSPTYLGYLENDKKKPGTDLLTNLKNNSNISIDWLLTGKGEPFLTDSAEQEKEDILVVKLKKGQLLKIEYED